MRYFPFPAHRGVFEVEHPASQTPLIKRMVKVMVKVVVGHKHPAA
jgi:hypothetical protein